MSKRVARSVALVLGVTFWSALSAGGQDLASSKSAIRRLPPKITISEETTCITGPRREDGTLDFVAALNQLASNGVTPQNNAVTAFWQAIELFQDVRPESISKETRKRYFDLLGIPETPARGEHLLSFPEFLSTYRGWKRPDSSRPAEPHWQEESEHFDRSQRGPWSEKEYPLVAKLLESNEKSLRICEVGLQRSRYYSPFVLHTDAPFREITLLPTLVEWRLSNAIRQLNIRAMLHLHHGRIADAWNDTLTCFRLARLVGQEADVTNWLFSSEIEVLACDCDRTLLRHSNVTAKQAKAWQSDLRHLPGVKSLRESWDQGTRLFCLAELADIALHGYRQPACKHIAFGNMSGTTSFGPTQDDETSANVYRTLCSDPRMDWDEALRHCNSRFNALVAAYERPTHSQQRQFLSRIKEETDKAAKEAMDLASGKTSLSHSMSPKAIARLFADVFTKKTWDYADGLLTLETQCQAERRVTTIAIGLAAYRHDHGKFPKILADLAPNYVDGIPPDPFTDGNLHYVPEGDGYRLYSVGPNERDDGGRNYWDDRSENSSPNPAATEGDKSRDDIGILILAH